MKTEAGHDWRRPSPIAVVFYVVRFGRFLVTDGLPMLAPLVAVWATAQGLGRTLGMIGLVLLVLVGSIGAVLSYLRFRFCLNDQQILIRRGIFKREQLNVGFDRIQDVSIDQPFYARPFGMAILNLDTAGSAKKEIALAGIPLSEARQMRDILVSRAASQPLPADVETETADDETLLLTRDRGDVLRYGLTANGLLWVAIFAGAVLSQMGDNAWGEPMQLLNKLMQLLGMSAIIKGAFASGLGGLVIFAGILLLALILPLLSMVGALWKYANYKLTVDGDTYHRYSGLLSRQEQTLRRGKVQAAVWRQNLIARWLGRINLNLRMVSAGVAPGSQGMNVKPPVFLIPAVNVEQATELTAQFLPGCAAGEASFTSVNRARYLRRVVLLNWLPPIALATTSLAFVVGWWAALVPAVGVPLAVACSYQRWRRYGYGIVGEFGCLRSGFLGTHTTLFPLFKVQRVDVTQSPGQRRAQLANLTIHLASHSLTMPYLKLADAHRFMDVSLYHAEASQQAWF